MKIIQYYKNKQTHIQYINIHIYVYFIKKIQKKGEPINTEKNTYLY